MENKRVEIAIRIDGHESFYVIPEGYSPPDQHICHGLDEEVEAIIRATANIQKMEWNIIRLLVATASCRVDPKQKMEILIDEDGQPAVRNQKTGEVTQL